MFGTRLSINLPGLALSLIGEAVQGMCLAAGEGGQLGAGLGAGLDPENRRKYVKNLGTAWMARTFGNRIFGNSSISTSSKIYLSLLLNHKKTHNALTKRSNHQNVSQVA